MNKEFITHEQWLSLEELGFDEPCIAWYNPQTNYKEVTTDYYWAFHLSGDWQNFIPAPLKSQVFRWFRKKYGLCAYVEGMFPWCRYYINTIDDRYEGHKETTYEKAEDACIDKLIEILKQK